MSRCINNGYHFYCFTNICNNMIDLVLVLVFWKKISPTWKHIIVSVLLCFIHDWVNILVKRHRCILYCHSLANKISSILNSRMWLRYMPVNYVVTLHVKRNVYVRGIYWKQKLCVYRDILCLHTKFKKKSKCFVACANKMFLCSNMAIHMIFV